MANIAAVPGSLPRSPDRTTYPQVKPRGKRYWSPSLRLLQCVDDYRRGRLAGTRLGLLKSKIAVVRHRFWSAVTGAEIPLNTWRLGEELQLPHPNGVVIHADAEIGFHCTVFQQVTIGTGPTPGVPRLGEHVYVGAGAKILGGVAIGDRAIIGANAVVLQDVPAGAIAVGIPAQVKSSARGAWDREERMQVDREADARRRERSGGQVADRGELAPRAVRQA